MRRRPLCAMCWPIVATVLSNCVPGRSPHIENDNSSAPEGRDTVDRADAGLPLDAGHSEIEAGIGGPSPETDSGTDRDPVCQSKAASFSSWQSLRPAEGRSASRHCYYEVHVRDGDVYLTVASVKHNAVARSRANVPFPVPLNRYGEVGAGARVSSGWVYGYDDGEFGCRLLWYADDGRAAELPRCLHDFVGYQNVIWGVWREYDVTSVKQFVVRLEFAPESDGGVGLIERRFEEVHEPVTGIAAVDRRRALVSTNSDLWVAEDGRLRKVYSSSWGDAAVFSLAVDSRQRVFMGGLGVVIRLTRAGSGYVEEWLVPRES